jgi:nucleoside-diphosphate-sugar epimerase
MMAADRLSRRRHAMKVLVTGASGYIGSHTAATLTAAGHEVRALVRDEARARRALAPFGIEPELVRGDMTDATAVAAAVEGCDAVIHAAGEIGVAGGTGPGHASSNVDGVRTVVGAALGAGCDPVVYTSTITVYLPTTESILTVDSPLAEPLSAYGASKLEAERLVRGWQEAGEPVTSVALGGVYGPISPHRDGSFAAVGGALDAMMLVAPGGMGVVDVRDAAELLCRAVEPGHGPRRFLAGGQFVTWQEWTDTLEAAAGRPIARHVVTTEEMVDLGRQFDRLRADGTDPGPLSEEAAVIMTAGVPTDDGPMLNALGITYRPVVDTFRDIVAYLAT